MCISTKFWDKVNKGKSCWQWTGWRNDDGYGLIQHNGQRWRAHRLVYLLFGYLLPKDRVVLHSCDNRSCVRPSHLALGTVAENMKDKAAKRRARNGSTRLNIQDVIQIRYAAKAGSKHSTLAKTFGVSRAHISRIVRGKSWGEL